jgi:serine phosphatase RsbU (regulator of sigma subunit)
METAARRYVRWVLTVHLALLVLVAAGVVYSAHEVYQHTRRQAVDQARERHELIARQTARGIDGHYSAILSDLKLLAYAKKDEQVAEGLKGVWVLAPALWDQMGQRVSHLVRIDLQKMEASAVYPQGPSSQVTANRVLADPANRAWLKQVSGPAVSNYRPDTGGGYSLVAVPVAVDGSLLAAIVPFGSVQRSYLDLINAQDGIAVVVLEDAPTTGSAASFPGALGFVDQIPDPKVRALAEKFLATGRAGSAVAEVPTRGYARGGGNPLGRDDGTVLKSDRADTLKQRLFVVEPLRLPGKRSAVVVSSWIDEVDRVVAATFRRAALVTVFVLAVVTAIIASTALQLIRTRVRMERERHAMLRRELDQARQIQLAWLPTPDRDCPRACDIAAANKPASHVSGDFYDWFELGGCRVAVTIGDVTGHGMAAAFLMATTQLLVRTTLRRSADPGPCLDEVNRQLCGSGFGGQFVTMLVAVVDTDCGEVRIASAGHYPPLVCEGTSLHPLPMETNIVLGIEPDVRYVTERYDLSPGSSLLLFTDGVIEARSDSGEHFALGRLRTALAGRHATARQMIDAVMEAVDNFRGGRDLLDDLTLVAFQLQPAEAPAEPLAAAM